jgi:hypothetical protein
MREMNIVDWNVNINSCMVVIRKDLYKIDLNPRYATLILYLKYNHPKLLSLSEKIWNLL